jgi:adenylate cyclase
MVLYLSGWNRLDVGDWETASARIERAMRLSPVDPGMFSFTTALATAQFVGERSEESVAWSRRAINQRPRYLVAQPLLAAGLVQAGREDEARAGNPALLAAAPGYTVAAAALHSAFRGATRARYLNGLCRAGLPE